MAASSSSSSFSTLDAKARPFVPSYTTKPNSTISAKTPPFAKPSSDRSSQMNPLAAAAPYFPSFAGSSDYELLGFEGFNGDDALELSCDFEDFLGMGEGPWNAPFDETMCQWEENDWIASLWGVHSLDIQGVRPSVAVSCKFSGASTSALSSQHSMSTSAMNSCNTSHSDSSFDPSVAQTYVCSSPMAHCPVSAYSTLAQPFASSAGGTSCSAGSLSITLDSRHTLPEELATSQNVKGEEGLIGKSGANSSSNLNAVITMDSSTSSGYESPLAIPVKLPKILTSKSESVEHDNYNEDSSETPRLLDLDVDSPCWKGTLAYQRVPFHFDETVTPHRTSGKSVSGTGRVDSQLPVAITTGDTNTTCYLEKSGNLNSDEANKESSRPNSEEPLDVAFSSLQKRPEHLHAIEAKGRSKEIKSLDICKQQSTDLTNDKQRNSGVLQLDQEVIVTSANQPKAADGITMLESDLKDAMQNGSSHFLSCAADVAIPGIGAESHGAAVHSGEASSVGENEKLINETLQCLRIRLLSRVYKDDNALKELLNDIILFVNDYSETSVLKNKKGFLYGCCGDPEADADQSQIGGLKGEGDAIINPSINNITEAMRREGDAVSKQGNFETCHDTSIQKKLPPIGPHATERQVKTLSTL